MDWIKVSDRLPGLRQKVLVTAICNENGERCVIGEAVLDRDRPDNGACWYAPIAAWNGEWPLDENGGYTVTHWMPYPSPAKEA